LLLLGPANLSNEVSNSINYGRVTRGASNVFTIASLAKHSFESEDTAGLDSVKEEEEELDPEGENLSVIANLFLHLRISFRLDRYILLKYQQAKNDADKQGGQSDVASVLARRVAVEMSDSDDGEGDSEDDRSA
jgi:hypothetical protein